MNENDSKKVFSICKTEVRRFALRLVNYDSKLTKTGEKWFVNVEKLVSNCKHF